MPVPEVKYVLAAPHCDRNALIREHLGRLEVQLASTREAVSALRDILEASRWGGLHSPPRSPR